MTIPDDLSFVQGRLWAGVAERRGGRAWLSRCWRRLVLLLSLTWLPLVLLAFAAGHAVRFRVTVPLFADPAIYTKFLLALPLLVIAEVLVDAGLRVQVGYFLTSGLIPDRSRGAFEDALADVAKLRRSRFPEAAILILAFAGSLLIHMVLGLELEFSTWQRVRGALTPAGLWYVLVSLPILGFFLLHWGWIFLLWAWFLYRVSRFDLELTPTHADRAGGLGFLGWGLASFAILVLALSTVLAGGFAREIVHRGASLQGLKYHLLVVGLIPTLILHLPLLAFSGRLARCRFRGLLEFGNLVGQHDRAFDRKWLKSQEPTGSSIVGSPDVSSLANLGKAFEDVERMWLLPFDHQAVLVLVAASLAPMIPLLATSIGFTDMLTMLGRFLV